MAYPATVIPAGTYQVIDSETASWAYTWDMGNRGITWIYGWVGGAPNFDAGTATQSDARPDSAQSDAAQADAGVNPETPPLVIDDGNKAVSAIIEHASAQQEAYATLLGLFSADVSTTLFDPAVALGARAYDDIVAVQQNVVDTHDAYFKALEVVEGTLDLWARTASGAAASAATRRRLGCRRRVCHSCPGSLQTWSTPNRGQSPLGFGRASLERHIRGSQSKKTMLRSGQRDEGTCAPPAPDPRSDGPRRHRLRG